jgi:hypothetical protein
MSGRRRVRRIGPNVRQEALAELELTVRESKEAGLNAKVRFWVIELGAEATGSSQATQQVTLTLDTRRHGVAGKSLISEPEQTGEPDSPRRGRRTDPGRSRVGLQATQGPRHGHDQSSVSRGWPLAWCTTWCNTLDMK